MGTSGRNVPHWVDDWAHVEPEFQSRVRQAIEPFSNMKGVALAYLRDYQSHAFAVHINTENGDPGSVVLSIGRVAWSVPSNGRSTPTVYPTVPEWAISKMLEIIANPQDMETVGKAARALGLLGVAESIPLLRDLVDYNLSSRGELGSPSMPDVSVSLALLGDRKSIQRLKGLLSADFMEKSLHALGFVALSLAALGDASKETEERIVELLGRKRETRYLNEELLLTLLAMGKGNKIVLGGRTATRLTCETALRYSAADLRAEVVVGYKDGVWPPRLSSGYGFRTWPLGSAGAAYWATVAWQKFRREACSGGSGLDPAVVGERAKFRMAFPNETVFLRGSAHQHNRMPRNSGAF